MLGKQISDYRVIQMVVGCVLVAGRYTVTAYDRTVHDLCRHDDCGQGLLCVNTVHICIMHKTLAL